MSTCTRRSFVPRPQQRSASTGSSVCRSTPPRGSTPTSSTGATTTMKNLKHILFAATLGSSAIASANAFNVNEHDAKAPGRAGAVAATDTDPSAVAFNPGGIAVAEGTNVSVDATIYMATGGYEPIDGSG